MILLGPSGTVSKRLSICRQVVTQRMTHNTSRLIQYKKVQKKHAIIVVLCNSLIIYCG